MLKALLPEMLTSKGRMGPQTFLKAVLVFAGISSILGLLSLFNPVFVVLSAIIKYPLLVLFVFILIRRSHDGNKNGFYCILWLIIWGVIGGLINNFTMSLFNEALFSEVTRELVAAFQSDDETQMLAFIEEYVPLIQKNFGVPLALVGFIGTMLTAYIINLIVKQTPGDNKYGPLNTL